MPGHTAGAARREHPNVGPRTGRLREARLRRSPRRDRRRRRDTAPPAGRPAATARPADRRDRGRREAGQPGRHPAHGRRSGRRRSSSPSRRTDLFNPNIIRASLGTIFAVPVAVASIGRGPDLATRAADRDRGGARPWFGGLHRKPTTEGRPRSPWAAKRAGYPMPGLSSPRRRSISRCSASPTRSTSRLLRRSSSTRRAGSGA